MDNHNSLEKASFGFWIYLMTDLIMFSVLFASFAVLRNNTFGGPEGREIFSLSYVFVESIMLLTSSLTTGMGLLAARRGDKPSSITWLSITMVLGLGFLVMECTEFVRMYVEGNSFTRSAFLSSFFALTGTHGLHIFVGLIWLIIALVYITVRGLSDSIIRKLTLFSMFWHFLDIVWIFIFTFVYLMSFR